MITVQAKVYSYQFSEILQFDHCSTNCRWYKEEVYKLYSFKNKMNFGS